MAWENAGGSSRWGWTIFLDEDLVAAFRLHNENLPPVAQGSRKRRTGKVGAKVKGKKEKDLKRSQQCSSSQLAQPGPSPSFLGSVQAPGTRVSFGFPGPDGHLALGLGSGSQADLSRFPRAIPSCSLICLRLWNFTRDSFFFFKGRHQSVKSRETEDLG